MFLISVIHVMDSTWGLSLYQKPPLGSKGRVLLQRTTMFTAPWTLGLEKAWQGEHRNAPTLVSPHLCYVGHSWCWGPQFQPQVSIRFRIMGSCSLQGQWEWKRHIKESPALCQHCLLHMFVILASYSTGDLSFRHPTHLGITWVFHKPRYFMYKVYQFSFLFPWKKLPASKFL